MPGVRKELVCGMLRVVWLVEPEYPRGIEKAVGSLSGVSHAHIL